MGLGQLARELKRGPGVAQLYPETAVPSCFRPLTDLRRGNHFQPFLRYELDLAVRDPKVSRSDLRDGVNVLSLRLSSFSIFA
jgi:hypothetical protein